MEKVEKTKQNKCEIITLVENTTKDDYTVFTNKIIAITKGGQTVVLEPEDLRQLEKVVGGEFKR